VKTIKTLQRRKYKSIDGYCTVPIISLQSASVHKKLVLQRKGYELLSLYFNRTEDPNAEQCPFLIDEDNVLKIKKAKEIIIANMAEPPGLQELATK
jgi:hypothetical protein